jgi:hypothetical protein
MSDGTRSDFDDEPWNRPPNWVTEAVPPANEESLAPAPAAARKTPTAKQVLQRAQRLTKEAAPAPRIALEWADDMPDAEEQLREIVQGVLTAGAMSVMYGESNSGKSYLATHLAFCMSRGVPWLGRQVEKGAVIYIAGEGAASVRRRIRAHRQHYNCDVGAFGLIPHALSLLDGSADVEDLIALIRDCQAKLDDQVLLIVVDTLARAMPGANENASEDMGRLVAAGDRIREQTGAHVLWIHHSGKDQAKGARGHSSLRASLDTEIEVTATDADHLHVATVTKQRDLDTNGLRLCGRFVSQTMGVNHWGDPITACAVVDANAPPPKLKAGSGKNQHAILAALSAAGKDMRITELATHLDAGRTSIYNSLKPLQEAGMVEVAGGAVHLIRR